MGILKVLLILVEVVTCVLLVGVILLQRSKNEGMGGMAMGAGMGEQLFGSRAGNVLTRTTIILACIFMGCTTLLAVLSAGGVQKQSIVEKKAAAAAKTPQPISAPAPQAPSPMAPAPAAPVESAAPQTVTIPVATPAPAPAPEAAPAAPAKP